MPRLIVMAVMFVHSFTAAAISVQVELEVRVNYTGLEVLQSSHFQLEVSESQQETFSNSPLLGST